MFDPGGVLHREKSKRKDTDAGVDVVADICFNFSLPPRSPPYGRLQGTISSSPAPPSEWLVMQTIYARVPKPGSVQSTPNCVSMGKEIRNNDISTYSD
jgi:hypothetical protein